MDLRTELTVSNLLEDPIKWVTVREMILSEQIPIARVEEIYGEFPEFAAWMAEQRTS